MSRGRGRRSDDWECGGSGGERCYEEASPDLEDAWREYEEAVEEPKPSKQPKQVGRRLRAASTGPAGRAVRVYAIVGSLTGLALAIAGEHLLSMIAFAFVAAAYALGRGA